MRFDLQEAIFVWGACKTLKSTTNTSPTPFKMSSLFHWLQHCGVSTLSRQVSGILLVVWLCGCSLTPKQKSSVHAFAESTTKLGSIAAEQFKDSRQKIVAVNNMRSRLEDTSMKDVTGGVPADAIAVRIATAEALQKYGELLNQLVESKNPEAVRTTATQFTESLRNAGNLNLSESEYSALESLTTKLGDWFLGWKRGKAVKKAVESSGPILGKIADEVAASFNTAKPKWSAALTTELKALDTQVAYFEGLASMGSLPAGGGQLIADGKILHNETADWMSSSSDKISSAVVKFKTAQKELVDVLKHDDLSTDSINAYGKEVQSLVTTINVLKRK